MKKQMLMGQNSGQSPSFLITDDDSRDLPFTLEVVKVKGRSVWLSRGIIIIFGYLLHGNRILPRRLLRLIFENSQYLNS